MSDNPLKLFEKKEFVAASGRLLKWRLECDALSDEVIEEIAAICAPRMSQFGRAIGVPRGGVRIAEAFNKYTTSAVGLTLVCDDVWTTGGSIRRFVRGQQIADEAWIGFVIFNRANEKEQPPRHVWCMWTWGLLK